MNTPEWITRGVSMLKPAPAQPRSDSAAPNGARSTRERLDATLRQKEEALSPRVLRRTLEELRGIVDPRVSEVEGGRRALAWPTGTCAPRRPSAATCGC